MVKLWKSEVWCDNWYKYVACHIHSRSCKSIQLFGFTLILNQLRMGLNYIWLLFFLFCELSFLCASLSDQGCLWLDQSLLVHIQDQPVTEKVTDCVSFSIELFYFSPQCIMVISSLNHPYSTCSRATLTHTHTHTQPGFSCYHVQFPSSPLLVDWSSGNWCLSKFVQTCLTYLSWSWELCEEKETWLWHCFFSPVGELGCGCLHFIQHKRHTE